MIPGDKAYFPGSDILANKFNIRDAQISNAVEYKFASVRELELAVSPIEGNFDFSHLQSIHQHVFQDMYEWAGQPRKVDFAKRNKQTGMINRFVPEAAIQEKAEAFNKFIADNNQLRGLTKPEFVKAITEVHTMLNELHPFREGNGRSTRIFLAQLSKEAGFELNIEAIDKDRWNLASHKAIMQYDPKNPENNLTPAKMDMRMIFHESLTPTREHAFKHDSRENAIRLYPDLKSTYERFDAIKGHASKLPNLDAASRLLTAETERTISKLQATTSEQQKARSVDNLLSEQAKFSDGGKGGPIDPYVLVAQVMGSVLKEKGYSPGAIEKAIKQAHTNLDQMKEAGIAAPALKTFDKDATRQMPRPSIDKTQQPGKDVDLRPSGR